MLDVRYSHLYFYQSLNRLQRGLSAIAELLVLVCACPVYHCVICVYAIRFLDRNFPINTYLLTEWIHLRMSCTCTGGFLASVQMMISASPIVESVLSVNDASGILVVSLTERPVSIRRLVTVVPNSWWFPCNRQYVQSKPVIGDVQRRSVCTPPSSSSSFISPSSIQNSSYKYQLTASRTVRLSLSANNATNIYMICFFSAH